MINGISEIVGGASVTISPNPFSSMANVKIDLMNQSHRNLIFVLYDIYGKEIKSIDLSDASSKTSIDFILNRESVPGGMYFYKLSDSEHVIAAGKLVVQ